MGTAGFNPPENPRPYSMGGADPGPCPKDLKAATLKGAGKIRPP